MRIKADDYAIDLVKKNGLDQATKIAERCMRSSSPSGWTALPVGPVFFVKPIGKDRWDLPKKKLVSTHGFWSQVFHILKKKNK